MTACIQKWLDSSHQHSLVACSLADGRKFIRLCGPERTHKPTDVPVPSFIVVHEASFYGATWDEVKGQADKAIDSGRRGKHKE